MPEEKLSSADSEFVAPVGPFSDADADAADQLVRADNRFERYETRFGVERQALTRLEPINLSAFVENRSFEERKKVACVLRQTCIDIGFFYLDGHGIEAAEFDELLIWSHRFFELPAAEKMKLSANNNLEKLGYVGVGGANPDNDLSEVPDLKERFYMNREILPNEPVGGRRGAGHSQWPNDEVLPGFAEFMKPHICKRVGVVHHLARAFALSLELPETYFDEMFGYLNAAFVLNYYPPVPTQVTRNVRWSFAPHTDYSAFTLLSQDATGGLQVRNSDNEWIDVPPVPGLFIVNLGDLFATWTNDLYASTLHRAVNVSSGARVSAPLFVSPRGDTLVKCLDTCQSPNNPPRYESVMAGNYVRALLDEANRTGRPGVAAKTSERLGKQ